MSTLLLPPTPRVVSNKENFAAAPTANKQHAHLRPTARSLKPRMGGIGRPKQPLFKHRQPSSSMRRKSDRLASIKRAQVKSNKAQSLKQKRERATKNTPKMRADKENIKSTSTKLTLPTITEKLSSIMSTLPFPLIPTPNSDSAAPPPQTKAEKLPKFRVPARTTTYAFSLRKDLDEHRKGEPYGFLHVAYEDSTQCLPFGHPADVFPPGPILPQVGDQPVFLQPDGRIATPVGYAIPDKNIQETQMKVLEQKMPEYKKARSVRVRQNGLSPYARPARTVVPPSSGAASGCDRPSPRVCAENGTVCQPGPYTPRETNTLMIMTPLVPPQRWATFRSEDPRRYYNFDHPIFASVFGNQDQSAAIDQSYHLQLEEARRLKTVPIHVRPQHPPSAIQAAAGPSDQKPKYPCYMPFFPKMPMRILEQAGEHPVWPFHVVPLEVQIPKIPAIVRSFPGRAPISEKYVVGRLADWYPMVFETCNNFRLMPKQDPPKYHNNHSESSSGPKDEEMYDHLIYWHLKSVHHGGLTDEGRRMISHRGPNMCLTVHDRRKPDQRGIHFPINSAILTFTCANFDRLLQDGRSKRDQGQVHNTNRPTQQSPAASASTSVTAPIATAIAPSFLPPRKNPMAIASILSPVMTFEDASDSDSLSQTDRCETASFLHPADAERTSLEEGSISDSDVSLGDILESASDSTFSHSAESDNPPGPPSTSTQATLSAEQTLVDALALYPGKIHHAPEVPNKHFNISHPIPVNLSNIKYDTASHDYAARKLPLRAIYVDDAPAFFAAMYIIHHPRNVIIGELLGCVSQGPNVRTTIQVEAELFSIQPIDCLKRAQRFDLIVQSLTWLGVASEQVWDQVVIANRILTKVLVCRGGIPNMKHNKVAVPFMEGHDLPSVMFTPFSPNVEKLYSKYVAELEERTMRCGPLSPDLKE